MNPLRPDKADGYQNIVVTNSLLQSLRPAVVCGLGEGAEVRRSGRRLKTERGR